MAKLSCSACALREVCLSPRAQEQDFFLKWRLSNLLTLLVVLVGLALEQVAGLQK